jgi:hypothetical protein
VRLGARQSRPRLGLVIEWWESSGERQVNFLRFGVLHCDSKLNVGSVIDGGVELELDSGFGEKSNASVTRRDGHVSIVRCGNVK